MPVRRASHACASWVLKREKRSPARLVPHGRLQAGRDEIDEGHPVAVG